MTPVHADCVPHFLHAFMHAAQRFDFDQNLWPQQTAVMQYKQDNVGAGLVYEP